jgi:prepilin-type N-terminal cleavage/methylation domain-containing protein
MKLKISPKKSGFTLLEVLLSLAIFVTLISALVFFLTSLLDGRVRQQVSAEVELEGVRVVNIMTQAIRNSDTIIAPAPNTNSDSLTLSSLDPLLNPTVFALSGDKLTVQEAGGSAIDLTTDTVRVSNLDFKNLSSLATTTPGTIQISFDLNYIMHDRPEYEYSRSFTAAATLR